MLAEVDFRVPHTTPGVKDETGQWPLTDTVTVRLLRISTALLL